MSRTRRAAVGFVTSLIQLVAQLATAALLSPLVLRFAGQEVLGAYGVVMQAVSYLWLMDFGFGVAFGRSLSQAFGRRDIQTEFRTVAATGMAFYAVSNVVVGIGALALSAAAPRLLGVSAAALPATQLSLQLLAGWAVIRTPLTIYSTALVAVQQLGAANLAVAAGSVIRLAFSVASLAAGCGLPGLVAAQIASEAISGLVQWWYFARCVGGRRVRLREARWTTFVPMFRFGSQYLLSSIATRMVYSTDQLIVANVSGLAAASIYYTTQMPTFILIQAVWRLADSSTPALNELHARGESDRLRQSLLQIGRYTLALSLGAAGGILLFNEQVVVWWVGDGQYAGSTMTHALAAFAAMATINHLVSLALVVEGRVRLLSVGNFTIAIANVGLSFVLGRRLGISGVMIASALAEVVALAFFLPKVMGVVGTSGQVMLRSAAGPTVVGIGAIVVTLLVRQAGLLGDGPFALILGVVVYSACWGIGTWRLALSPGERDGICRQGRAFLSRVTLAATR